MLPLIRSAVVVLITAVSLFAQPSFFGEPFPLTHARYGTSRGHLPLLTSNGHDAVLFWSDDRNVRSMRFEDGAPTTSRAVADADAFDADFDAVWTGSHFLVVGTTQDGIPHRIVGRRVDANGAPLGEQFTIADGRKPRLAFNGEHALLLFMPNGTIEVSALLLEQDGARAEPAPRPLGFIQDQRIALTSNGSTFAAVVPRNGRPHVVLFDSHGDVQSDSPLGEYGSGVSIASDGRRYLAVAACAEGTVCGPVYTRIVEPDGSMSAPVILDPPFPRQPFALWTGAEWVISYVHEETLARPEPRLEVVRLDASTSAVKERVQIDGAGASLAVIDGDVVTAYVGNDELRDTIFVGGVAVSYTATQQRLLTTASSNENTLVAWQEIGNNRTTVHAGVRTRDGQWRERQLFARPKPEWGYEDSLSALAASNGHEFLLVTSGTNGLLAHRLDANGSPLADPIVLTGIWFDQVLWNGQEYLLIDAGNRLVRRMSTSGVVSAPVQLSSLVGQFAEYATDGAGNLYAVWVAWHFVGHFQTTIGIFSLRLGNDLQPLDAAPVPLTLDESAGPFSVAWDGTQYAVAWTARAGLRAIHVSTAGALSPIRTVGATLEQSLRVTRVPGGVAIQFDRNVTFLRHDGTSTTPFTLATTREQGRIEALPNGDVAYLEAIPIEGAPYEEMSRVTMRIGSAVPLTERPHAPPQAWTSVNVLNWVPPAEPADGYRVEYRTANGPWVELDQTFGRDEHAATVPPAHLYRVRAWNDAGVGAYSAEVGKSRPKRRAVR
ncbi:MAG TPA: fibronectin type III domain-containing protein [Thermoanaerobaculia bacterium]|nr:fibronectin type III domain-containing protein [Thermoanaerobaculia bacterium]